MSSKKVILIGLLLIVGVIVYKFGYQESWYAFESGCRVERKTILGIKIYSKEENCTYLNFELSEINKYIPRSRQDISNISYTYVDDTYKRVVVGLYDNSNEKQEEFRKNIIDSKYIEFEKSN